MKFPKHPYLVVNLMHRPHSYVRTGKAGWADQSENFDTIEQYVIVDSLNNKVLTESSVIIDLIDKKCVKNRYSNGDEEVVPHYFDKYKQQIDHGIALWLEKNKNK